VLRRVILFFCFGKKERGRRKGKKRKFGWLLRAILFHFWGGEKENVG
jgi:hypothetical protein